MKTEGLKSVVYFSCVRLAFALIVTPAALFVAYAECSLCSEAIRLNLLFYNSASEECPRFLLSQQFLASSTFVISDSDSASKEMFSSAIFEHLQVKLDEDALVREELRNIVQVMERQGVCHSANSGPSLFILISNR